MSIFSHIVGKRPRSSAFNLSHARKFSFDPGICTPTLMQEVLPSDRWKFNSSSLVRFQPLLAPLMHLVDVYNYSFFVPARLCMQRNKFEVFITGGQNGDGKDAQGNTIEIPYIMFGPAGTGPTQININWLAEGTLSDYLGIGTGDITAAGLTKVNAMPFIAFWLVWCQYFRDENLQTDYQSLYPNIFENTGDITAFVATAMGAGGASKMDFFTMPHVAWEKDYFTSALPFAQKGNPVETPLTGTATVSYMETSKVFRADGSNPFNTNPITGEPASADLQVPSGVGQTDGRIENIEEVELTSGGFTINQLRLSARLQEWLEKMARGGSRYIEQIKAHFGVTSSDARLQRAEFLSGGKIPVNISEVLQTGEDGTTPLGEMAGHGVSAGNINTFNRFFEEHGYVLSVMFMRPRTAYQQGIPRMFTRRFDKLDWAWPSFAHLGEQEVKLGELYFQGLENIDELTFGYQSRYAEYKYIPSTVHGEFRDSLDFWHWGRIFPDVPTLSSEFISCDPDARIFNVTAGEFQKLYCIVSNRITAIRPLPYHSTPAL